MSKKFTESKSGPDGEDAPIIRRYAFEYGVTLEEAKAELSAHGVALDGERCRHSHDCCANWYPSRVKFEKRDGHVIATQDWHQNI
jgi:hypothetical protein